MDELQLMVLQKDIEKKLKEQADDLMKEIFAGCEETDSTEVACGKMIANSIAISARISLGAVLDILIKAGVYYGKNVPLFRRNGYRKSGTMIP